jgi:hypothetical protein
MGKAVITVEGKSKKYCAHEMGRQLNEARKLGLHKEGKTLYTCTGGTIKALVVVES